MSILADALIEAILYISTGGAKREDSDARVIENLVLVLQGCDPEEKEALKAALARVRPTANDRARLDALNALESGILGEEEN